MGSRNNGSSDNITGSIDPGCQTWAYIGLDSNGKFEGYVTSANVKIFIYGYSQYGIAFINAIEKTISAGWHDINCAANASSDTIGLIFIVKNSSADTIRSYGIRKNGSTDSYTLGEAGLLEIGPGQIQFVIIGCDTAQLCEFYPSDASDIHLYLIGYIFDGTTFQINAANRNLSIFSTYSEVDVSALDITSGWALVQINCSDKAARYGSLRYPGDTVDDYKPIQYGAWKWQKLSINHIFEGKIQDSNVQFFIIGTAEQTLLTPVSLDGLVKVGTTLIEGANIICYNLTRKTFVGRTLTDTDGEYTFTDAGYEDEEFLVGCHYVDSQQRRFGGCKLVKLAVA